MKDSILLEERLEKYRAVLHDPSRFLIKGEGEKVGAIQKFTVSENRTPNGIETFLSIRRIMFDNCSLIKALTGLDQEGLELPEFFITTHSAKWCEPDITQITTYGNCSIISIEREINAEDCCIYEDCIISVGYKEIEFKKEE